MTEAHVCEQLAQGRYLTAERPGVELASDEVSHDKVLCEPMATLRYLLEKEGR